MSREDFRGSRVAIFGLGRSGFAVALAVKELGGVPHVFDERGIESIVKRDLVGLLAEHEIAATYGWDGSFGDCKFEALVVNPAVDHRHPILAKVRAQGIEILSEVEFAYRISLAPIVAITGTNGKSTTAVMTYLCLKAVGIDSVLCGNIFGSGYPEQPLTEAALYSTKDQVLVAEVSSFQLEWVSKFRPLVSVITNISPDHLDRYESFSDYGNTKMRIWAAQGEGDTVIVRANDPVVVPPGGSKIAYRGRVGKRSVSRAIQEASNESLPDVFTFGASGNEANTEEDRTRILDTLFLHTRWPFIGTHNYANASVAMVATYAVMKRIALQTPESEIAKMLDRATEARKAKLATKRSVYSAVPLNNQALRGLPAELAEALDDFKGLEHRMEVVGTRDGVLVINNSMCTNPAAVVASVQAVQAEVHILVGGVNKELDFLPLKNFLGSRRHTVYIYGKDRAEMFEMLGRTGTVYETMEEAFGAATLAAKPGTVIMLAPGCASTDQFRDFRHRGDVFRSIAKEWLI